MRYKKGFGKIPSHLMCQKIIQNLGHISQDEELFSALNPALSVDGELCCLPQLFDFLQVAFNGPLVGRQVDHAVHLIDVEHRRKDSLCYLPTFAPNISRSTFQMLRISKSSSLSLVTPAAWVISRQWRGRSFDSFSRRRMANIFFACIRKSLILLNQTTIR